MPLRGYKDQKDRNFMQVLKLKPEDNPAISDWLLQTHPKHTSHQIQDEVLGIMAEHVIAKIYPNQNTTGVKNLQQRI